MENNKIIRIIDLVIDEKFIDLYIDSNDCLDNYEYHDYIIIKNRDYKFKFIKNKKVNIIPKEYVINYINSKRYDAIFLHSLYSVPISLFPRFKFKSNLKIIWLSWGYDIYESPKYKKLIPINLYHNKTLSYICANQDNKTILKRISDKLSIKNLLEFYFVHKILSRIDYHSGILPYETELIKLYNRDFKASPVRFNYSDRNMKILFKRPSENNILVGNSKSKTNNHLDVLDFLKNLELKNRKVIVPLNYGDDDDYVNKVLYEYNKCLGNSFVPLLEFMPKDAYFSLLDSCSIAIFMLERQQAIGNISHCMCRGMKVFLSESSSLYKYYKDNNYIVFSIQTDLLQKNIDTNLSIEEMYLNFGKIEDSYNEWENNRMNIYKKLCEKHNKENL